MQRRTPQAGAPKAHCVLLRGFLFQHCFSLVSQEPFRALQALLLHGEA
jgi:hypothetical protein